ncbi:MAG: GWxTD domain-containing protein [Candidatus Aminicenantes bacterium]|nr:GWxTD domain-containing protein [Candidatus Aminicenantes bacterium]
MRIRWGLILFAALLLHSCAIFPERANLAPEEKEFLSTVRYIISQQERKAFLALPSSERQAFIENFWKKRDPSPETEANEYREEYYRRIEEAKHLFTEGGTSGWLQDRGRVYVLLGPPEQREQYPRGYTFYGLPMEIWHYGFHQLIFVDSRWNGNFELQSQSARMLAEINAAQMQLKPEMRKEEKVHFDFDLEIKKISAGEMIALISVPYQNIWFSSEEGELKTVLEATLNVYDTAKKKVSTESRTCPISLSQDKLKSFLGQDYVIEIPLVLEPGEYQATVSLKNLTGETQLSKKIKLTV